MNWVTVLSIVVAIETQIGNGTMSLANMIPDAWIPWVKAWAANLGTVGALIVAYGAYGQKPNGIPSIVPAVKPALLWPLGLAVVLALMATASPGHAQTLLRHRVANANASTRLTSSASS